jgi:hypothetical protein
MSWGRHAHSAIRRSDAVLTEPRPIMPTNKQFRVWCRRIKASDREASANVFEALHDPWVRAAFHYGERSGGPGRQQFPLSHSDIMGRWTKD